MPKKKNLIREAIAEAKQLKTVALANAKIQIEEAFRPQLQSLFTSQVRNEMEDSATDGLGSHEGGETDYKAVTEQETLDSSEVGTADAKQPDTAARSSSRIDNPKQEVEKFGKPGPEKPVGEAINGVVTNSDGHEKVLDQLKEDDDLGFDLEDEDEEGDEFGGDMPFGNGDEFAADIPDMGAPDAGMGGEDEFGDEEDILDIESILRELEAESLPSHTGLAREDVSATAAKDNHTQTVDAKPNLAPAGERETLRLGESHEDEDEVDESLDIDEMLREMDSEEMASADAGVSERLKTENVRLRRGLREAYQIISYLKNNLSENNMLNAKLLLTNKLFKKYNLNNGQKIKIVEMFDKANTLREAKLIYATLAENYNARSVKVTKKVANIVEGLASKPTGSTKPKTLVENTGNEIVSSEMVSRFKKLAHIK